MGSASVLDCFRRNDPELQHFDFLLESDTNRSELEALIQALRQNRTLRSVGIHYANLQSTETTTTTTTTSATAAAAAAATTTTTTTVNERCMLELAFSEALGSVPSLRTISINGAAVPLVAATKLLRSAKKCEALRIGGFFGKVSLDHWDQFVLTLRQHQHLKQISVGPSVFRMGITGGRSRHILQENLMQGIAASTTLKAVRVSGIGADAAPLSLESVRTLCQSRFLAKLWLYDFALNDDHLMTIERSFRQKHSQHQLQDLRMSSCTLGSRGLEALANIVSATSHTRALSAGNGCAVQLQVLNLWIQEMQLVNNSQQTWDGCASSLLRLATALQDSSIRIFRMEAPNRIEAELKASVSFSTENVQDPDTPRTRRRHPIASSLVQSAFSQILEHNHSLEAYSILCSPESKSYRDEMKFYLKLNKFGRGRLLGTTGGSSSLMSQNDKQTQGERTRTQLRRQYQVRKEDWIDVFGNVFDDLSCLYYLLSANPSLCNAS